MCEIFCVFVDVVIFFVFWVVVYVVDVFECVFKCVGEDVFEATARWCVSAFANGGVLFVNVFMSVYECGGVV